jgi:hypothetical protein
LTFRTRQVPRRTAIAVVLLAISFGLLRGAGHPGHHPGEGSQARPASVTTGRALDGAATGKPLGGVATGRALDGAATARTLSATSPASSNLPAGGPCSVPGIGDIGGLLGFCSLGQSGLIGGLNDLCNPGVPQPESATSGVNALIRPPAASGTPVATPYNEYGMAGQFWAPYNMQCSDMTALIGNDVAGMLFDFAKALDRVMITVYQAAAGEGIVGWLQNVTDHLVSGLGNAIYFPYVAIVVILAAIWLAWQGLIRKRGTRTIEGTIWMVVACAAAIWLIGRPADFTGLGKGVSDGISTTLNAAFANLPSPGQSTCLPVRGHDPQISPSSFSYTSGRSVVDQNANELWTVLVCKPWLDGEFGTTTFAASGRATPVSAYARQLLWAQAIAVNEKPTTALISAKQDAYAGIAQTIKTSDPSVYPLFQGKEWTTRLEIGFSALIAAVVAGLLVLLISVTLILLKLGFLLLLIVGPFFLLIGTHPGFGRVVAVRWFEMLVGVLLKQAAVALALSVLLYCYALIMGTADSVLPWALKILMITLVTVAVLIYRKPFQHLFAAVGYGAIGATERAEAGLSRAAATARSNTRDAATLAVPGFAGYRAARWARRNPAQAAGLALTAASAASAAGVAAGAAAGMDGAAGTGEHGGAGAVAAGAVGAGAVPAGVAAPDAAGNAAGATGRARAWGASAGKASASQAPPLRLPPSQPSAAGGQVRAGDPAAGLGASAPQGGSGVPPSWSARSQASRRPAPPPAPARTGLVGAPPRGTRQAPVPAGRRPDAGRPATGSRVPDEPRRTRATAGDRPAWPWGRSGQTARAPQDRPNRSAGPPARPAGRPRQEAAENGSAGTFPGLPYGLQSSQPDDPPASPFWSRPIRRRK